MIGCYQITQLHSQQILSIVIETSSIVPEKYVDVPAYSNPVKFNVSQVSNDTDIINNRVVKVDGNYQVNFSITMGRLTGILANNYII